MRPGATVWLLDGRYRGADSMITPPESVSGTAEAPVRIRARREGAVLVDGEGGRAPVVLHDNAFVWIEGLNACCSRADVVYLSGTRGVAVKRVVGWDAAADQNAMIFSVAYGTDTLLEDTAGFGSARKIYQYFKSDGPATIRRAWGEWNRSINKGPKMTFSLTYDSRNLTVENAIGTWRSLMPERYVLMDNGKPFRSGQWSDYMHRRGSCGAGVAQDDGTCLVTDGAIDQMYAVVGVDALGRDRRNRRANIRWLGSLAYVAPGVDTKNLPRLVLVSQLQSVTLENDVAYWPEENGGKPAFVLGDCTTKGGSDAPCETSDHRLVARSLTAFGGPAQVGRARGQWDVQRLDEEPSTAELHSRRAASVFQPDPNGGASLCYRYRDGQLTKEPLWPWPMNDRIKAATVQAGREAVDVTKTIETLFGPIPDACKMPSSGTVSGN